MSNKEISLKLTMEETNKIMTALGNLPYVQVFELISKIQQQASGQIQQDTENGTVKANNNGAEKAG